MNKLITSGSMPSATKQLTSPCSDCPMRRDSLKGWLGGSTPQEYAALCHSGSRCAGLAIYRSNTCKSQPKEHKLPSDHNLVLSNIMEFMEHHTLK